MDKIEISTSTNPAAEGMAWAEDRWVADAVAMLKDLGVVTDDGSYPFHAVVLEGMTALWKRTKAAEAALDRVFPGWQMDNACLPNCQGACCET